MATEKVNEEEFLLFRERLSNFIFDSRQDDDDDDGTDRYERLFKDIKQLLIEHYDKGYDDGYNKGYQDGTNEPDDDEVEYFSLNGDRYG